MKKKHTSKKEVEEDVQQAWHSIDTDVVLHRLDTNKEKGLTTNEAKKRLEKYGPNLLAEEEERFKALKLLIDQFKDYFVIMLLIFYFRL